MPTGIKLRRIVNGTYQVVESQTESLDDEVLLDLSGLTSIRPGALASVAALAVSATHGGHQVRVRLPTDSVCCEHLETVSGFCWYLSDLDVKIEGRRHSGDFTYEVNDAILSMTTVTNPGEVEALAEEVYEGS